MITNVSYIEDFFQPPGFTTLLAIAKQNELTISSFECSKVILTGDERKKLSVWHVEDPHFIDVPITSETNS